MSSEIRCYLFDNNHSGLIFNPHSIRTLRQQYRTIGCLTGNLPEYSHQNNQLGLPLQLSYEQCYLLSRKNIIHLYKIILPISDNQKDYFQYISQLENQYEKQKVQNGHEKINEILLNRQTILQTTNQQQTDFDQNHSFLQSLLQTNNAWINSSKSLDLNEQNLLLNIIQQRLQQFTFDFMLIQLPLQSTRTNLSFQIINHEEFKQTLQPIQQLHSEIFCDLYEKNLFISNGHKFGGDYLVYFDDPSKSHSTFIIKCILNHQNQSSSLIPLTHLIAQCRVAVNVNKIFVLATKTSSSSSSSQIQYLSMNWNGF
ncbi:unnamed protein product [Adineta steineri]|uniref:tRNA-intron lyase n=1 Tax=Adineta steineri TaxID=433720 RepID=A0A815S8H0_9BILA|nr:unnamed protein product [Adineta steineri]